MAAHVALVWRSLLCLGMLTLRPRFTGAGPVLTRPGPAGPAPFVLCPRRLPPATAEPWLSAPCEIGSQQAAVPGSFPAATAGQASLHRADSVGPEVSLCVCTSHLEPLGLSCASWCFTGAVGSTAALRRGVSRSPRFSGRRALPGLQRQGCGAPPVPTWTPCGSPTSAQHRPQAPETVLLLSCASHKASASRRSPGFVGGRGARVGGGRRRACLSRSAAQGPCCPRGSLPTSFPTWLPAGGATWGTCLSASTVGTVSTWTDTGASDGAEASAHGPARTRLSGPHPSARSAPPFQPGRASGPAARGQARRPGQVHSPPCPRCCPGACPLPSSSPGSWACLGSHLRVLLVLELRFPRPSLGAWSFPFLREGRWGADL